MPESKAGVKSEGLVCINLDQAELAILIFEEISGHKRTPGTSAADALDAIGRLSEAVRGECLDVAAVVMRYFDTVLRESGIQLEKIEWVEGEEGHA